MFESETSSGQSSSPAPSSGNADSRWARRQSCLVPGEITHPRLTQPIPCIVRDTSSSGARIEIPNGNNAFSAGAEKVPDTMTLVMPRDRASVECRVTWRRGTMLGVRYMAPVKVAPKRAPSNIAQRPAPSRQAGLLGKLFK